MQSFIFSVISMIGFAGVNVVDGYVLRKIIKSPFIATQVLGIFSILLFGLGMLFQPLPGFQPQLLLLIASGIFEAYYIYMYLQAIEGENISYVVSIFSLSPLFILLLEYYRGLTLSVFMIAGVFAIVLGTVLLVHSTSQIKSGKIDRFTRYAFVASLAYGISLLTAHAAVEIYEPISSLWISRLGVGIGSLCIFAFIRMVKKNTDHSLFQIKNLSFLVPELLYVFAMTFMFLALINTQNASYVAAILAIQPLFVFLLLKVINRKKVDAFTIEKKLNRKTLFLISVLVITIGSIAINIDTL